jgi:hypothetical protein
MQVWLNVNKLIMTLKVKTSERGEFDSVKSVASMTHDKTINKPSYTYTILSSITMSLLGTRVSHNSGTQDVYRLADLAC